jgi:hypothetical protein
MKWDNDVIEENNMLVSEGHGESRDDTGKDVE